MKRVPVILIFIAFSMAIVPTVLRAADPAALQSQIEKTKQDRQALLDEQGRLQAELDAINKQSTSLGTAVKSLDATKKKLANDIALTQSKVKSASLNIQSLENTISEKQDQIGIHHEAIARSISDLSAYDSHNLITDILTYDDLSEVWGDQGTLTQLTGNLHTEIDNLRQDRIELANEKTKKEKTQQEQIQLASELTGQKKVVEDNETAKAKLLADTKSKESAYQALIAQNLARQKEFDEDLFQLESALKIAIDPTLLPDRQHGILSWPLAQIRVTTYFGTSVGNLRIYADGFHNGVDFRATPGTAVKAMMGGTVEGVGNTDDQKGCYSYGRWVFIRHPNGLSSIYAHLSGSAVTQGQTVTTGQLIGYSGGTPGVYGSGNSTGPHLHIGLFATQGVSVQSFSSPRYLTTGSGCHNILLPVADVKAYLDPLAYLPVI